MKTTTIAILASLAIFCATACEDKPVLVLPPVVNFFQYAAPEVSNLKNARIWGWSKDGKVAYSTEWGDVDNGGNLQQPYYRHQI